MKTSSSIRKPQKAAGREAMGKEEDTKKASAFMRKWLLMSGSTTGQARASPQEGDSEW